MIRSLAAIIFVLIAACNVARADSIGERAPVTAEVASELDAANAAFSAAWTAGDVDALVGSYTQVAVVHPPAGGVLTTREQIRGVWAPIVNWQRVGHRLEPTLRWALEPGLVLEMGRWHSSRTVDGQSPWLSGCYTVIWRRGGDGRWRMDYDAWTAANENSWACRPRG
jgi:ketosteroid isomerase-like protein